LSLQKSWGICRNDEGRRHVDLGVLFCDSSYGEYCSGGFG
jgi:hypothetical protein